MRATTEKIQQLIQPHLLQLRPYSSARSEFKGQASVFLDANEHPVDTGLNRYPDPLQLKLKAKIASLKGVETEQIFLGNGSDEAIDLLIRLFCRPGLDEIITLPPTYGMYQVAATISNIKIREIQLDEQFQPDVSGILNNCDSTSKLLFLCSPNNPTGNQIKVESIMQLLENFPGIVVLDEAYIDFAGGPVGIPLLLKYPNLVVLQTFSKAWGLAGIRLGMAFANPLIIDWLNKIKPPYNVNTQSQQIALNKLQEQDQNFEFWCQQRNALAVSLNELNIVQKIYPSAANFLLVKFEEPDRIYKALVKAEIIVRNRSKLPLCSGCLRITVGTETENNTLIRTLKTLDKV